jgi:hypothetical protein
MYARHRGSRIAILIQTPEEPEHQVLESQLGHWVAHLAATPTLP